MIKNITYGSDPEFFIINRKHNIIVPSTYVVEGTKDEPHNIGDGYKVLRDNILIEGNVPVTRTKEEFVHSLVELKMRCNSYLREQYEDLSIEESDCMELQSVHLTHPEALLFGCDPFLNAWDEEIHKACDLASVNYRTAGFHVHIGYDRSEDCSFSQLTVNKLIAKAFDFFVVLPSYIEQFDHRRFGNYGGIGQYRDTSYGVECRSLGGYFAKDEYLMWVIQQTEKALEYVKSEENMFHLMYCEKPVIKFDEANRITFDTSIYHELNISFEEQLYNIKKLEHVRNIRMDR